MPNKHFILTRFNLLIFNRDKEGQKVRSSSWLEHRFSLFERYCLPSLKNQTCHDFEWIVLFDSTTPERFKKRVDEYQNDFPQLIPVFVEPENGRYFAQIFREEVRHKMDDVRGGRVLTTYLDNDDALDIHFVEDIQRRASSLPDGTFITYDSGYQLFTDHNYVMRIRYPRNHFMSVVEKADIAVKTIYGYGSHYYVDKIPGVKIEHVKDEPMWCEVIHDKNMGNDAYFLRAKMVRKAEGFGFMVQDSSVQEFNYGLGLYLFKFLPRYFKTLIRRCGYFIFGNRFK